MSLIFQESNFSDGKPGPIAVGLAMRLCLFCLSQFFARTCEKTEILSVLGWFVDELFHPDRSRPLHWKSCLTQTGAQPAKRRRGRKYKRCAPSRSKQHSSGRPRRIKPFVFGVKGVNCSVSFFSLGFISSPLVFLQADLELDSL